MTLRNGLIAPDGWACLHIARVLGIDSLGGSLLNKRAQNIEG